MTQLFSSNSTQPAEKKASTGGHGFSGPKVNQSNFSSSHFPTKLKNFFRINNSTHSAPGNESPPSTGLHPFRQTRLFRGRSPSSASTGAPLEPVDISPTANANPYFAHQGPPAIRHHDESSRPPSPPETPKYFGVKTTADGGTNSSRKDDMARKLRRVASAPNAQGLFAGLSGQNNRPTTAESKNGFLAPGVSQGSTIVPDDDGNSTHADYALPVAPFKADSAQQRSQNAAFRRTYSSNSIKVRTVEVGPQSFDKIKLLGKGDVGKVYLVREKKSGRLYAMKGK
ncbi:hypothetical protein ABW19_dt0205290 [Dactylella cylindrospora]|nr:hypothetical protein ABW19_dt0205290 [Dactylella cylindrospora]